MIDVKYPEDWILETNQETIFNGANPIPPYNFGDTWVSSYGDTLRCVVSKRLGESFDSSDWVVVEASLGTVIKWDDPKLGVVVYFKNEEVDPWNHGFNIQILADRINLRDSEEVISSWVGPDLNLGQVTSTINLCDKASVLWDSVWFRIQTEKALMMQATGIDDANDNFSSIQLTASDAEPSISNPSSTVNITSMTRFNDTSSPNTAKIRVSTEDATGTPRSGSIIHAEAKQILFDGSLNNLPAIPAIHFITPGTSNNFLLNGKDIEGEVLYDSGTGTRGNYTLSKSVDGYARVTIEGNVNNEGFFSMDLKNPSGKRFIVSSMYPPFAGLVRVACAVHTFSGTSVVVSDGSWWDAQNGTNNGNVLTVHKVTGYPF